MVYSSSLSLVAGLTMSLCLDVCLGNKDSGTTRRTVLLDWATILVEEQKQEQQKEMENERGRRKDGSIGKAEARGAI